MPSKQSSLHLKALAIVKELFPYEIIHEEYTVKDEYGKSLYFDIYIKNKLAVELDGIQHYKPTAFFHNSLADFKRQQKNDRAKDTWCDLNNIMLIRVPYFDEDKLNKEYISQKIQEKLNGI